MDAMKIRRLEARTVCMALDIPYRIAYEEVTRAENIFLRMETDAGIIGYGCAAPAEAVTGESCRAAEKALETAAFPLLLGADPLRRIALLESLRDPLQKNPSARAAVDMALLDILGKKAGLPVWRILGGFRDRIRTSVTIGILPLKETIERARTWAGRGFTALKIKGGLDMEQDVERVLKVREALGEEIELRFDANQGYSAEQSIAFVERVAAAKLEIFEQPVPTDQDAALQSVTSKAPIPVMADESLKNLKDAYRLAKGELVDMVNVKIMKVGGSTDADQINAVARSAGLEVMVGCMDEAALGIAAGLHFALSHPNVQYADLDGHLALRDDPSNGAVLLRDGILYPADKPGFGKDPV